MSTDAAASKPSPPARGRRFGPRLLLAALSGAVGRLLDNPVLTKEFRCRMRGDRAYWVLLAYVLLLSLIVGLVYAFSASAMGENQGGDAAQRLGKTLYQCVFIGQSLLVMLITPALTAGALSLEREQRTYEMLIASPIRAAEVVRGKLTAAVAFVILLLTASLPLASISFLVGGVSPSSVLTSYVAIALSALVYGAIGMFWSAGARSTATSTVLTYGSVIFFFLFTIVVGSYARLGGLFSMGGGAAPPVPFQSVNPLVAVFSSLNSEAFFGTTIPSWVNGVAINLLLALSVIAACSLRMPQVRRGSPAVFRILTTLLWTVVVLVLVGSAYGQSVTPGTPPPAGQLAANLFHVLTLTLLVLIPVFATGRHSYQEGETPLRHFLKGLLPHRLLGGELSNGLPLLVFWFLIATAIILTGEALMLPGPWTAKLWQALPAIGLTGASLLAFTGIAHLFSVVLPTRFPAIAFSYLAAALCIMGPSALEFSYEMNKNPVFATVLSGLLYITPVQGFTQLADPIRFWSNHVPMALGQTPMWLVTSLFYLFLAVLTMGGAWLYLGVVAGRRQVAMEEANEKWLNRDSDGAATSAPATASEKTAPAV